MQGKINKVCFVFRDLNKENSSSQPLALSIDNNQEAERIPLLQERNQLGSLIHSSLQHWGIVFFITNEREHREYAKVIDATIQNRKINCNIKDWDDSVEKDWKGHPAFK